MPGHHIQVDVKYFNYEASDEKKIRRFQYTAIDDATRVSALRIYRMHAQENAIKFVDYVWLKFTFRIHAVSTNDGHEFQEIFHWHLADLGNHHVYIKPRTPRLNGKVECSHGTDETRFYQLLSDKNDIDFNQKLTQRDDIYIW